MTAEQTARELAKLICDERYLNEDGITHFATQALKRYGNGRLEEAATAIEFGDTDESNPFVPFVKELQGSIRNLKEPE